MTDDISDEDYVLVLKRMELAEDTVFALAEQLNGECFETPKAVEIKTIFMIGGIYGMFILLKILVVIQLYTKKKKAPNLLRFGAFYPQPQGLHNNET